MDITKKDRSDLEKRSEELEQFAFIAAHDLRHPLSSITSYLELLSEQLPPHPEAGELLQRCLNTSAYMRSMIEEFLTIARSKAQSLTLETVNLEEALARALENLSNLIGRSQARINTPPLPRVRGDFLLLVQIFQNLLANAIACCERPVCEIIITAERNDQEWILSVQDNGPGIPASRHDEIFQPYRRLENSNDYARTGMGLTFCKRALEFQGGRIWLESLEGKGSTFRFALPSTS